MNYFGRTSFGSIPLVVKNLIIINAILFFTTWLVGFNFNIDLNRILGLFFPASSHFKPYQLITHMFMHGGFTHILFNMFALWMFGRVLEQVWGPKRFFVYYFVTGIGAALIHSLVNFIEFSVLKTQMTPEQIQSVLSQGYELWERGKTFTDPQMSKLNGLLNIPTVGASGAVFGVLLAFGMLFPNTTIMLLIPPIPIKAKYFVMIYGGIELWLGLTRSGSNIAHFAHLGGMLFGFILIKFWNTKKDSFY